MLRRTRDLSILLEFFPSLLIFLHSYRDFILNLAHSAVLLCTWVVISFFRYFEQRSAKSMQHHLRHNFDLLLPGLKSCLLSVAKLAGEAGCVIENALSPPDCPKVEAQSANFPNTVNQTRPRHKSEDTPVIMPNANKAHRVILLMAVVSSQDFENHRFLLASQQSEN